MTFTKMHGLGNDYVYVNCFEHDVSNPAALARAVSDRHTGIGGDGLILICPSESADARMEMYNADGSRAQMCGNGLRCDAKYVVDHGLDPRVPLAACPPVSGTGRQAARGHSGTPHRATLRLDTDAGVKEVQCFLQDGKVGAVRIDMGEPSLDPASLPCKINGERVMDYPVEVLGRSFRMTCVSMGNPHAVMFVADLDEIELPSLGPALENHDAFPQRVNAHFVRVDSPTHVTMITWERGSGATQACGTGACAVAVAAAVTGRTERAITATLPGGDLELEWREDNRVYMTGPAVEVFTGVWPGGPSL